MRGKKARGFTWPSLHLFSISVSISTFLGNVIASFYLMRRWPGVLRPKAVGRELDDGSCPRAPPPTLNSPQTPVLKKKTVNLSEGGECLLFYWLFACMFFCLFLYLPFFGVHSLPPLCLFPP